MDNNTKIQVDTDFQDKVKLIRYDPNKNLMFASSKDGQFKCWKLPPKWIKEDDI